MSSYTLSRAELEEIARRQLEVAISDYTTALNNLLRLDVELTKTAGRNEHVKRSLTEINKLLNAFINQQSPATVEDAKAATAKMSAYVDSIHEFLRVSGAVEYFALCNSLEDKIESYRRLFVQMSSDAAIKTECQKLEKVICTAEAFLKSTPVIPVELNLSYVHSNHEIKVVSDALATQGEICAELAKIRSAREEERLYEQKLAEEVVQHEICAPSVATLDVNLKATSTESMSKATVYELIDILEAKAVFPNDIKYVKTLRESVENSEINTKISIMSTISLWDRREDIEALYRKYSVLASKCALSAVSFDSFMDYEDLLNAISEIEMRLLDSYETQQISEKLNETLRELGMVDNGVYKPKGREKALSLSVTGDGKYALLSSLHNNAIYLESAALSEAMFDSCENKSEYMNNGCVMMNRIIKLLKEKGVNAEAIHTCTDSDKIETLSVNMSSSARVSQKNDVSIHAEVK